MSESKVKVWNLNKEVPTVSELSKPRAWSMCNKSGKIITKCPSINEVEQELDKIRTTTSKRGRDKPKLRNLILF